MLSICINRIEFILESSPAFRAERRNGCVCGARAAQKVISVKAVAVRYTESAPRNELRWGCLVGIAVLAGREQPQPCFGC